MTPGAFSRGVLLRFGDREKKTKGITVEPTGRHPLLMGENIEAAKTGIYDKDEGGIH